MNDTLKSNQRRGETRVEVDIVRKDPNNFLTYSVRYIGELCIIREVTEEKV